jgi:hypothetical protein
MKETKVYQIETKVYSGSISRSPEARALYEAAEKVFLIPPFNDIVEAVVNDNVAPMKEFLQGVYESLKNDPFTGPTVTRDIVDGTIYITTDGGRKIIITPQSICIDFMRDGEGSTIAAGEVIGHIWANDPGDRLQGIMVRTSDGDVDIDDYNGPVHPQLGRTVYDSDFRRKFEAGELKWFQQANRGL